jgi:hypothetical protein
LPGEKIALQPWFKIKDISLSVDIDRPTQDDQVISGSVGGQLALPGVDVGVAVDFTQGDSWTLRLDASGKQIAGLDALDKILPSRSIEAILPADLTKTSYGLGCFTPDLRQRGGLRPRNHLSARRPCRVELVRRTADPVGRRDRPARGARTRKRPLR